MNFTQLLYEKQILLNFAHAAYASVYPMSRVAKEGLESFELDTDWKTKKLNGDIIFYTPEYNEACHCHPEMTRDSFTIPTEIADSLDVDRIANYLRKQKEESDAKMKKEREERERKDKEWKEKTERAQYENLKKKYG